jgi:DNA/RNA-binding domain of Phe-tRNA-synthetase-like protein
MDDILPIVLSEQLRAILPGMRVHAFVFKAARIGVGHAGLDPLRRRVLDRVREQEARTRAEEIPNIQGLIELLDELGCDPSHTPPLLLRDLRGVIHRDPFPVDNDAQDGARLLALYYLMPVFILDARTLHPPLVVVPCPREFVLATRQGPVRAPGTPVLADAEQALRSVQHEMTKGRVHEQTREFLVVMLDPGVEGAGDHGRLTNRVENWMNALTGAHLVGASCRP